MQIKTFQPTDHKLKVVVYGASGTGKTVLGSTAPKPIFASAEGGLLSIADKNIPFVEINTLKDLQELLKFLQTQKHDFETVIIDSITEVNDIIKQDIEKRTGKGMQLQDWGELAKKIKTVFRGFRDLPMHTIFIAQENAESDEGVVTKIVPSLNGKAATEIAYFMDIVGYLFIDKTGERKLITLPNNKLLTKDRSNLIGNGTEPDFSVWVEKVKSIKIGKQEVLTDYEADIEEEGQKPAKDLPQPTKSTTKEPMISEKTGTELFATWNEMWNLSMEKLPEEKDSTGSLKYTEEKSDATRRKTMESLFKVDSSTKLTEKQAKDMIKRCRTKIVELKKLPTPIAEPEKTLDEQIKELSDKIKKEQADYDDNCEIEDNTEEFKLALKTQWKGICDMREELTALREQKSTQTAQPKQEVVVEEVPPEVPAEEPSAEQLSEPEEPIYEPETYAEEGAEPAFGE